MSGSAHAAGRVLAVDVELTPDDLRAIDVAASRLPVQGHRCSEGSQRLIDR